MWGGGEGCSVCGEGVCGVSEGGSVWGGGM